MNSLEEFATPYLCNQCSAECENDVAVLVRVLEDRVTRITGEFPAACLYDFAAAVEGFVAADEVQGIGRIRRIGRIADLDGHGAAETGAAVGEGDQA